MSDPPRMVSFVLRVAHQPDGALAGIVERVGTGHKERFGSAEEIGAIVARMMARVADERW
jgi:hypothetical protein